MSDHLSVNMVTRLNDSFIQGQKCMRKVMKKIKDHQKDRKLAII